MSCIAERENATLGAKLALFTVAAAPEAAAFNRPGVPIVTVPRAATAAVLDVRAEAGDCRREPWWEPDADGGCPQTPDQHGPDLHLASAVPRRRGFVGEPYGPTRHGGRTGADLCAIIASLIMFTLRTTNRTIQPVLWRTPGSGCPMPRQARCG